MMRHEYRVTKYDPKLRNTLRHYSPVEWTFFAQVGKRVGGRVLTMAQYLRTEANYLQVVEAMLREASICELEARGFETKPHPGRGRTRKTVTVSQAIGLARLALRERLDGKLVAPLRAYVHFTFSKASARAFLEKARPDQEEREELRRPFNPVPSKALPSDELLAGASCALDVLHFIGEWA